MNLQQLMTAISTDRQTITQICGILGLTVSSDGTVSEIATNLNNTQLNLKPFFEKMAVDAKVQNKTLLEIAQIYTRSFQQQMQLQQTDRFSAKELFRQRFGIDPEQAQPGSQAYDTWQYLNRVYIPGAENIHAFGRETQARTILDLALYGTESDEKKPDPLTAAFVMVEEGFAGMIAWRTTKIAGSPSQPKVISGS